MARPLHIEYKGALYHLTSRWDRREVIFDDDQDRRVFLRTLGCPLPISHVTEPLHMGQTKARSAANGCSIGKRKQRKYGPCARVPFGQTVRRPSAALHSLAMEQPFRRRARLAYGHRAIRCGATYG